MRSRSGHLCAILAIGMAGCCSFSVTAVSESCCNGKEPKGIPFYLPKPLLVISKNFQYLEESTVGLTASSPIPDNFDNQAGYASLNAQATFSRAETTNPTQPISVTNNAGNVNITAATAHASDPKQHSGGAPVVPNAAQNTTPTTRPFFTYQIIFIPDLTQKHYLRIKGGPGEVRATMNLVNGWMYTGLGPFYLKDSSTAQNILATGIAANLTAGGVADIINSTANLSKVFQQPGKPGSAKDLMDAFGAGVKKILGEPVPKDTQCVQAEIHVYEPFLTPDGGTEWREINPTATHFEGLLLGRDQLGAAQKEATAAQADAVKTLQDAMNKLVDGEVEARKVEAKTEADNAAAFRAMALNAAVQPPSPLETAAALQALAPPVPRAKHPLLDWLCLKRPQVISKEAAGPTTVTVP